MTSQETMDIEAQAEDEDQLEVAIFKKANQPVTLKFVDVIYTIKLKREGKFLRRNSSSVQREILNGVSGMVQPGEMLAMLGPSGSGKTTLLTALGGRLGGMLHGTISYNGKPLSNAMKRNTGFVTQDDVLHPHLTVSETLMYTALLRLPNSFSKQEKIQHAEAVVNQLGLVKCKDSIVGGPMLRGVSGGERKRVSIGQEMLINPSLLLLDEPTSGLDSTNAQRIVSTLLELARGGRTVVLTIHQPSSRLFYMFHKVLLLCEGNPLYFGQGSAALDYFSSIGHSPSVAVNPSDFLLDLANGVSWNEAPEEQSSVKRTLVYSYRSNINEQLKSEIRGASDVHPSNQLVDEKFGRWNTTWWQQFTILLQRGVKERRHVSFSGLNIFQILFVAVLVGMIWWQADTSKLQEQIGLLFFIAGFWGMFPLYQAIFTFPQERTMLAKERSSGMYRLSSYFMSRTMADLPMELLLPIVFITIVYWMVGLKPTAGNFIYTLSVLLLSVLVCQGMGLAVGALIMDLKSATVLASVIMLTFLLAAGFYTQSIPSFIGWIKYFSISHYSYKLFLGSQFKPDETYRCGDHGNVCLVGDFPSIKKLGLGGQVVSFVVMLVMLVLYRLIAYLALMRVGVTKKLET